MTRRMLSGLGLLLSFLLFTGCICTTGTGSVDGSDSGTMNLPPVGTDSGMYNWPPPPPPPPGDAGACANTTVQAMPVVAPVDIIWFVDTSGSMDYETATVQNNLNIFAANIAASGLDYHVVLIGDGDDLCVAPPLGGPGCTSGPRFLHIDTHVGSNNGLAKLLETYPLYQGFLRPDSVKSFVAVSDDESSLPAVLFDGALGLLTNPGFANGYVFHSIVAFGPIPDIGCSTGAAIGNQYLTLSGWTGGLTSEVCASDWTPIFAALSTAVIAGGLLPCVYDIPDPGPGMTIDPNAVNLEYTTAGTTYVIPNVPNEAACGPNAGWYYDDPVMPTQVIVCPDTCAAFGSQPGEVALAFGCATVIQ